MSKSYLNKVELKDGQIILFHRQHVKRPIYHMRIHVRGMQDVYGNKVTYVQESTGETDLEEARRYEPHATSPSVEHSCTIQKPRI